MPEKRIIGSFLLAALIAVILAAFCIILLFTNVEEHRDFYRPTSNPASPAPSLPAKHFISGVHDYSSCLVVAKQLFPHSGLDYPRSVCNDWIPR